MLLENYSEKYRTAVSDYFKEFSENGEEIREDVCGGPSLTFLYVRESDGRLIGMLDLRQDETAKKIGTFGYAIRPCERRKGYGSMLVEAAMELCGMMDINEPELFVKQDNTAGLAFLSGLGFKITGRSVDGHFILKKDDRYYGN